MEPLGGAQVKLIKVLKPYYFPLAPQTEFGCNKMGVWTHHNLFLYAPLLLCPGILGPSPTPSRVAWAARRAPSLT